jgi:hypothetical protein
VAGAIRFGDVAIVFGALIGILDHQADGGAGCPAFEDTRKDADDIGLLPLGCKFGRAGAALVEERLDVGLAQRETGRAAINHRAERSAVALSPCGESKNASECVEAHALACLRGRPPFFPLARAAAALAGDRVLPPSFAI